MSETSNPALSTAGNTSERAGIYPPGKMYFSIQGLVTLGPSERPVDDRTITPFSFRSSAHLLKNES